MWVLGIQTQALILVGYFARWSIPLNLSLFSWYKLEFGYLQQWILGNIRVWSYYYGLQQKAPQFSRTGSNPVINIPFPSSDRVVTQLQMMSLHLNDGPITSANSTALFQTTLESMGWDEPRAPTVYDLQVVAPRMEWKLARNRHFKFPKVTIYERVPWRPLRTSQEVRQWRKGAWNGGYTQLASARPRKPYQCPVRLQWPEVAFRLLTSVNLSHRIFSNGFSSGSLCNN